MDAAVGGRVSTAAANAAMERYASGDDAAFGDLYDALAPRLLGYACRQTRDRALAEDLVQQTLLQMHRTRARFVAGADVLPWAFAILRRLIIDGQRRNAREVLQGTDDSSAPSDDAAADELFHAKWLAAQIQEAAARLPESWRVALDLVKGEGLDSAQAGQVLGISANAVKIRVHRACEALREQLGEHVDAWSARSAS